MISLGRARRYLVAGFLSPMLIFLFHFVFPDWGLPQSMNVFYAYFILAFIQVGLLEESSKYVTFQWVSTERHSEKFDLPIATMFYSMMASVGFAIVENITYVIRVRDSIMTELLHMLDNGLSVDPVQFQQFLNDSVMNVALTRAVSAAIIHMVCGIIMGYFLSLAHQQKYIIDTKLSNDDNIITQPNFKRWWYVFLGIITASIFHGMYDINLMLPDNTWEKYFHYVNIFIGLLISSFIIKKMVRQSIETRKTNLLKKTEQDESGR